MCVFTTPRPSLSLGQKSIVFKNSGIYLYLNFPSRSPFFHSPEIKQNGGDVRIFFYLVTFILMLISNSQK